MTPQCTQIIKHLKYVGDISNMEAQGLYRCRALPKRISELRNDHGYQIHAAWKRDRTGQRYVRYSLVS